MPKPNPIPLPSVEYLHSRFALDAATGVLTWKPRPREDFSSDREFGRWNTRYANKVAGLLHEGYWQIRLRPHSFKAHRIIYKMTTRKEPPETIDHVDGEGTDNRPEQLRPASKAEQTWNMPFKKNNKSGYRGVFPLPSGRWQALIQRDYIGSFDTAEEASAAYEAEAKKRYGKFYRELR